MEGRAWELRSFKLSQCTFYPPGYKYHLFYRFRLTGSIPTSGNQDFCLLTYILLAQMLLLTEFSPQKHVMFTSSLVHTVIYFIYSFSLGKVSKRSIQKKFYFTLQFCIWEHVFSFDTEMKGEESRKILKLVCVRKNAFRVKNDMLFQLCQHVPERQRCTRSVYLPLIGTIISVSDRFFQHFFFLFHYFPIWHNFIPLFLNRFLIRSSKSIYYSRNILISTKGYTRKWLTRSEMLNASHEKQPFQKSYVNRTSTDRRERKKQGETEIELNMFCFPSAVLSVVPEPECVYCKPNNNEARPNTIDNYTLCSNEGREKANEMATTDEDYESWEIAEYLTASSDNELLDCPGTRWGSLSQVWSALGYNKMFQNF